MADPRAESEVAASEDDPDRRIVAGMLDALDASMEREALWRARVARAAEVMAQPPMSFAEYEARKVAGEDMRRWLGLSEGGV